MKTRQKQLDGDEEAVVTRPDTAMVQGNLQRSADSDFGGAYARRASDCTCAHEFRDEDYIDEELVAKLLPGILRDEIRAAINKLTGRLD